MTLVEAARYRLDHWRERWSCHPFCTATGPLQPHDARCTPRNPPHHPTIGLLADAGPWGYRTVFHA